MFIVNSESQSASPKIPREELNRRRILASARELFIKNGVDNVNMHQIAKTAGVGQASLYRRYSDKGDICLEIACEEYQPLFDEVQAFLDQSPETAALDRLYHVIVRYVSFLEAKVPWLCEVGRASTGHRPLQSPLCQWMRNISRNLLNEAVEQETYPEWTFHIPLKPCWPCFTISITISKMKALRANEFLMDYNAYLLKV